MKAKQGLINFVAVVMFAAVSQAAAANTPASNIVTGPVTGVSGGDHISVNGHLYAVKASSPASNALQQVRVGQVVDVVLDGPPNSSTAQVVVIHAH